MKNLEKKTFQAWKAPDFLKWHLLISILDLHVGHFSSFKNEFAKML